MDLDLTPMFWNVFLLLVPVFFVGDIADQRALSAKRASLVPLRQRN
jgi:hypothetical protein